MISPLMTLGFSILLVMLFFISQDKKSHTPRFQHSYFKSEHHELNFYNLNMSINFQESKWHGSIDLFLKSKIKVLSSINFDMHSQKIKQVLLLNWSKEKQNNTNLDFLIVETEATKADLGQVLTINMPSDFCRSQCEKVSFVIRVIFETDSTLNGKGNNFLSPQQTFDNAYYFYYSSFYPIFCRQFIPIHDSMVLRAAYNASIYVPKGYNVWMSAEQIGREDLIMDNKECSVFHFSQSIPISSYLLNLAVGVLYEKKISSTQNISILVEQRNADLIKIKRIQEHFDEYLNIMEKLLFPLPFSNTKIILMPKSFPDDWIFSPHLIFITTADFDIEQISFMIITYYFSVYTQISDWSFLYLAYGYTKYILHKVLLQLDEDDAIAQLNSTVCNFSLLLHENKNLPNLIYLTEMQPNLFGISPAVFSEDTQSVDKGLFFFLYLDQIMEKGDFLNFTKDFLKKNQFGTIDSQIFQKDLLAFLNSKNKYKFNGLEQRKKIDWRRWLTGRGDIPWLPGNLTSVSLEKGIAVAREFIYKGIFDRNYFEKMNRREKVNKKIYNLIK